MAEEERPPEEPDAQDKLAGPDENEQVGEPLKGASDAAQRMSKMSDKEEVQFGPGTDRRCTDVICCVLFAVHWIAFIIFILFGLKGGTPTKLYRPRDFKGDYCGIDKNWNSGPDYEGFEYLVQLMNVSSAVDTIAKQLVCSSAAETALTAILDPSEVDTYMCACCKTPCESCASVLHVDDLSLTTLPSTISGKMVDLTDKSRAVSLFAAAGSNEGDFSGIWSDLTKWFSAVCVTSCSDPVSTVSSRTYVFSPAPDMKWKKAWDTLATHNAVPAAIRNTISQDFNFKALPSNLCPYHERYCVPWPGVGFEEVIAGFCTFKMPPEVLEAVGATASSLNIDTEAEYAWQGLGDAFGDAIETWDVVLIVAVLAFASGFLFLVLIRFLVRCVVWSSLFIIFALLVVVGAVAAVRAGQCAGTDFVDSSGAYVSAAQDQATNAITGTTLNTSQETMSGNGADYRGYQTKTRTGRLCQTWAAQTPHAHRTVSAFPDADLKNNFCRNPMNSQYIWCYTTDPETRWEFCNRLGVQPWDHECPTGYKVPNKTSRDLLMVFAIICWVVALLWMIIVCCLWSRIALAIALNEVAADFLSGTKQVLLIPILQALIGACYVFVWMFCAAFILSKVPDDYVPTTAYATYAEAHGTETEPGECTKMWPQGYAWKYQGDPSVSDDPCSGANGNTEGMTPKCWRCTPPRYIFGVPFAWAFFSLLWNNAFLIACGQTVIAGAVNVWFFRKHGKKNKGKPVRTGLRNALRYHTGSMAFGAFILALVQFIRYCLMYYQKQMEQMKNEVAAKILAITAYVIWCLEKCLKFLTKNAYIQIAIRGTTFCTSAKNAFDLIWRNGLRFAMLAALSWILNVIGTGAVVIMTCFAGFFIVQEMHPEVSVIVPMCIFTVIAWVVAKLFMTVFHETVDTMLQCFLVVEEDPDLKSRSREFVPNNLREQIHGKE